jgi:hypothetical protein
LVKRVRVGEGIRLGKRGRGSAWEKKEGARVKRGGRREGIGVD